MTKQCPIILNNEAVTVVKFDNIEIQFPSIHKDEKTVFVNFENGKYKIVENIEKIVSLKNKRNLKKTTVEEITVEQAEEVEEIQIV